MSCQNKQKLNCTDGKINKALKFVETNSFMLNADVKFVPGFVL